jgi:hypothetical protein
LNGENRINKLLSCIETGGTVHAALDGGAQFALSDGVALTPELGFGIASSDGGDTIKIFSFGLFSDVSLTNRLVLLVGGSVDYSPDLHYDDTSTAASIGLALLL